MAWANPSCGTEFSRDAWDIEVRVQQCEEAVLASVGSWACRDRLEEASSNGAAGR